MMKPNRSHASHLAMGEISVAPGGEWVPALSGWSLIQVVSGTAYWLHPRVNLKLETGAVLLLAESREGSLRASQLSELTLAYFRVDLARLIGLITLSEQRFFQAAALNDQFSLRILSPESGVAAKLKVLGGSRNPDNCWFRLQLLQCFMESFEDELKLQATRCEPAADARERLREFLKKTPASDLLGLSFSELVQLTRCTPRHLSRIFHEVVGMSFRDKQAELRLARALDLLATSDAKVVDVALESGYQSLSLFNLMFKRRVGVSPGKWRQQHHDGKNQFLRRRQRPASLIAA